jgi:hypothetical protein
MSYDTLVGFKSHSRGCFFCGAKPRTDEHVLPNWINKAWPMERSWLNKFEHGNEKQVRFQKKAFDRSLFRWTVKEVCSPCNNGWMSQLEDSVKGVLERLLAFDHVLLSIDSSAVFRRWAVKTHMMRAQFDQLGFPFPESHRDAIRHGKELPDGWDIWIAPVSIESVTRPVIHRNWSALAEYSASTIIMYSQTTLVLGSFVLVVTFVSDPAARRSFLDGMDRLIKEEGIHWNAITWTPYILISPLTGMMSPDQAILVSDSMRRFVNFYNGLDFPRLDGPSLPSLA